MHLEFDSVAQLVEHNTFNVGVLGSSPSWVTKQNRMPETMAPIFFMMIGRHIPPMLWLLLLMVAAPVAVAQQPGDEQLAAYYFDRQEYDQAAQLYETLYQRGHNKLHYQRLLSSYLELSRFRDAQRLVEQRRKSDGGDLSLMVDEGVVLLRQKQNKKANKCFESAIGRITANLQPVPDLAMAFERIERLDMAVKTYLTAREKSGSKSIYFNELTALYQQMGDHVAMTNEYFRLLDEEPRSISSVQLAMQRALNQAPDNRLAEGVRSALVERVREHPENRTYIEMMTWFSLQQKDFQFALEQAEAADARFPDGNGEVVMRVARIAQTNRAYDVSISAYRYLQQKGKSNPYFQNAVVGELEVEFEKVSNGDAVDSKQFAELKKRYLAAFDDLGKNAETASLMRHYAQLLAYHGGDVQEAVDMLDDLLEIKRLPPQVRDEAKLELGDMLLFAGQVWDASLLYSQVEKSNRDDVLGSAAKFRNARLSYFNHDFQWAVSQLNVLRSSTSKLIANDAMQLSLLISDNMEDDSTYSTLEIFADADLQLFRNQLEVAWDGFDAVAKSTLSHPLHDEVLLRKAQIRCKQGRYAEADSLLQRLVDFYPTDITADDALWQMAEMNETHLNNPDKARQCYERILLDYPTSLYADSARKRYNQLKSK